MTRLQSKRRANELRAKALWERMRSGKDISGWSPDKSVVFTGYGGQELELGMAEWRTIRGRERSFDIRFRKLGSPFWLEINHRIPGPLEPWQCIQTLILKWESRYRKLRWSKPGREEIL